MQKVTYDFIYIKYPKEINPWGQMQIGGCQGLGGGENGELLINGYKVSVMQDEYILETCCTI